MSIAFAEPGIVPQTSTEVEQRLDLGGISWDRYLKISHAKSWTLRFWGRQLDGRYRQVERSSGLTMLGPDDVTAQLRLADQREAAPWVLGRYAWTRDVMIPRYANGG